MTERSPRATAATWRRSRAARIRGSRRTTGSRSSSAARLRADRLVAGRAAAGSTRPTAASTSRSGRARGHAARARAGGAGSRTGDWRVVEPDLGFPAGKNKTMLIDLAAARRARARLRLRTNLEIYWDALRVAERGRRRRCEPQRLPRAAPSCASAASRVTTSPARRCAGDARLRPASRTPRQRWRDLDRLSTPASATSASCWPASTTAT